MSELPLRSLVFLHRPGEVLLAMKKRGFGVGKWNGVGGKPEPGETMLQTAIRETEEEIGVTPLRLSLSAMCNFYFHGGPNQGHNQTAVTYLCDSWRGEPIETDEMRPQWFAQDAVPYKDMWSYSRLCLPKLLAGANFTADYHFNAQDEVIAFSYRELSEPTSQSS